MRVHELIAQLATMPQDAAVAMHGCDCCDFVGGMRVTGGVVNLLRVNDDLDESYDYTTKKLDR